MLTVFDKKIEAAKRLDPDTVSKELFDFIKSISNYLVDLNRKQIKEDSQDIFGKPIGFYSKATDILTDGRKEWGTPFDGDDTGSWLDGFYIRVLKDVFFFGSTDPKTDDILSSPHWLSHDLFGLTDDNLKLAIEHKFKPFILKYYKKNLIV